MVLSRIRTILVAAVLAVATSARADLHPITTSADNIATQHARGLDGVSTVTTESILGGRFDSFAGFAGADGWYEGLASQPAATSVSLWCRS